MGIVSCNVTFSYDGIMAAFLWSDVWLCYTDADKLWCREELTRWEPSTNIYAL